MRWTISVEYTGEDGNKSTVVLGFTERPAECTASDNVGVNLQESKQILHCLHETVVSQQLHEHCEHKRKCSRCGISRSIKECRRRRLDTVLGTVRPRTPHYHACRHCAASQRSNPVAELLPDRAPPELWHLQVSLGTQISYRKAAHVLRELLPPTSGTNHTTMRSRVMAIGERIDKKIQREIAENRTAEKPAKQMIIGIDGAFVKAHRHRRRDRASLEIITGRIETEAEPGKMFAIVRDRDGKAKQQLQALFHRLGLGPERPKFGWCQTVRTGCGRWWDAGSLQTKSMSWIGITSCGALRPSAKASFIFLTLRTSDTGWAVTGVS